MPLTVKEVLDLIGNTYEFFSVTFIKRTDGSIRKLNCRRGVKKHLAGGSPAYNFTEKGLICVWSPSDMGAHGPKDRGYRTFPADAVIEISAHNRKWIVSDGLAIEG